MELDKLNFTHPGNRNILFTKATAAYDHKKYKKARAILETLLKEHSDFVHARCNLGLLLADHLNEPQLAREQYNLALETDPEDSIALSNLALLIRAKPFDEYELAKALFIKSLAINPQNEPAHGSLALLYDVQFKEYGLAIEHFKKAIEINPLRDITYCLLANVYAHSLNQYKPAIANYEQAIRLNPWSEGHGNLGMIMYELKNYRAAHFHLERYVKVESHNVPANYILANTLFIHTKGKKAKVEAEKYYRRTLALDPDHAQAHVNLAYLLSQTGRMNEAKSHYITAYKINPSMRNSPRDIFYKIF